MRGLMTSIIQTNQRQRRLQSQSRPQSRRPPSRPPSRRSFSFQFTQSNRTRSTPQPEREVPRTPSSMTPSSMTPSSIIPMPNYHGSHVPVFTTNLESNENRSNYYSLFEYEDYNIRYYHNNEIQQDHSIEIMNTILQYINDYEEQEFEHEFEPEPQEEPQPYKGNNDNIKNKILQNTIEAEYKTVKHTLKNDTCPILYSTFHENDIICMFKPCNHAIDKTMLDSFMFHFCKCPLCNVSLVKE